MTWVLDHVQIAIPSGSEEACRAFYVGLLGMTESEKPADLQSRGGLWLKSGDAELHLGVEEPFRAALKAHPAFAVPDVDQVANIFEAAGHTPRWDDAIPGTRRFYIDDPFGNRLEFLTKRGRAP